MVGSLFALAACNLSVYPLGDPFYTSTGEWDSVRFPLLKPYELANGLDGKGWFISLPSELEASVGYSSIEEVDKIAVYDGVIMGHSDAGYELSSDLDITAGSWFVLIPSQRIQKVFTTQDEFERYIMDQGVGEVVWATPDALDKQFASTRCLDWIPGCK